MRSPNFGYRRSNVAREKAALTASYYQSSLAPSLSLRLLLLVVIMALAIGAGIMQAFHVYMLRAPNSHPLSASISSVNHPVLRSTLESTREAAATDAVLKSGVNLPFHISDSLHPLDSVVEEAAATPPTKGDSTPVPQKQQSLSLEDTQGYVRSSRVPPLSETVVGNKVGEEFHAPEKRFPDWWAWGFKSDSGNMAAGGGSSSCLALNSEFSPPRIITEEVPGLGGRLRRRLEYGHWRVRWPRFVAASHAEWFAGRDLVGWRQGSDACVGDYENRRLSVIGGRRKSGSILDPRPLVLPYYPAGSTTSPPAAWSQGGPPSTGGWEAPSDTSQHWLYFCEPRYTVGKVSLTDAVTVSESPGGHDCGPGADLEQLVRNGGVAGGGGQQLDTPLFWGVIPATWTWQHWCENTLPKMAQVESSVLWEEVWGAKNGPSGVYSSSSGPGSLGQQGDAPPPRLLARHAASKKSSGESVLPHPMWSTMTGNQELLNDRFPIVAAGIYRETLNMTPIDVRSSPLSTPRLVHACHAPPLHPFLWQLGQSSVFSLGPHTPPKARRKLVYCSRRDSKTTEHPGRLLLNEDSVVALLKKMCAASSGGVGSVACEEVVTFNHRAFNNSVGAISEFFSDAIGLISPHGGCLTNVNLLPCNAGVLEIMPLMPGGAPTEPHWHMLYMQSVFLEMRYWMLPVEAAQGTRDDMMVPLDQLEKIVGEMLTLPPQKKP